MNTINLLNMTAIYNLSTTILGTESFIMAITLLTLRSALKNGGIRSKSGILFLSIAMGILGAVNWAEYMIWENAEQEQFARSIFLSTASMEMFLLFTAYMSMLRKEFATKRRTYLELAGIILFTTPAIMAASDSRSLLFDILFAIGLLFYSLKLAYNYYEYRREIKRTRERIENYMSDDCSLWLSWINRTFGVVIVIGTFSVFIPMTDLTVLMLYSIFLFFAYFYIYISVIRNIYIFDKSMSLLESSEIEGNDLADEENRTENEAPLPELCPKLGMDLTPTRQKLLNEWIAGRGYTIPGVTATEVATQLKTNRTKFSLYLKNELNTTYYQWIAELRIEDAKKQLIEHPDRTVNEIAISVGIEDRDNFRHVFRRYVGVSPTVYRKQGGN